MMKKIKNASTCLKGLLLLLLVDYEMKLHTIKFDAYIVKIANASIPKPGKL